MKAVRFVTRVSETGTIQVPNSPSLFEQEVEEIVLPKTNKVEKSMKAAEFVNKWAGFLKDN
jgi:hypothetical protein